MARLITSSLASVVSFNPQGLAKPNYQLRGGKSLFMRKPKVRRQNNPKPSNTLTEHYRRGLPVAFVPGEMLACGSE